MSIAPTPARIRLPRLATPPATILEFLCGRFPHITSAIWLERISTGGIRTGEGAPVTPHTPYQSGLTVLYRREVERELTIPFGETVLHEDERILVADKPHFLPVTPSGGVVNECLLFRLQRKTGIADLAPAHRLDRDTAGVILFTKLRSVRAAYTQLFAERKVQRKYLALARVGEAAAKETGMVWQVEDRLEPEPGSFRMRRGAGEVNARTTIKLVQVHAGIGLFELQPTTGKKHQLRIHMTSLGFPILNDPLYPDKTEVVPGDFTRPMQLLASELAFTDPHGHAQSFQSRQKLARWPREG